MPNRQAKRPPGCFACFCFLSGRESHTVFPQVERSPHSFVEMPSESTEDIFHSVENCPGQRKGCFPQVFRNWAEIVENTFAAVYEAFVELTTCFPKRILNLWDIYENLCEIS